MNVVAKVGNSTSCESSVGRKESRQPTFARSPSTLPDHASQWSSRAASGVLGSVPIVGASVSPASTASGINSPTRSTINRHSASHNRGQASPGSSFGWIVPPMGLHQHHSATNPAPLPIARWVRYRMRDSIPPTPSSRSGLSVLNAPPITAAKSPDPPASESIRATPSALRSGTKTIVFPVCGFCREKVRASSRRSSHADRRTASCLSAGRADATRKAGAPSRPHRSPGISRLPVRLSYLYLRAQPSPTGRLRAPAGQLDTMLRQRHLTTPPGL